MLPIVIDNKRLPYGAMLQYIGEAFSLVSTPFGTNMEIGHLFDDNNIKIDNDNYTTFFRYNKHDYLVQILNDQGYYELLYGTSTKDENHPSNDDTDYSINSLYTNDALHVLNRVFYIFNKIILLSRNITKIKFGSADSTLHRLYVNMMGNESFLTMIDKLNFTFEDKDKFYWFFKRRIV